MLELSNYTFHQIIVGPGLESKICKHPASDIYKIGFCGSLTIVCTETQDGENRIGTIQQRK
jgi:hypothetical protein